MPEVNEHAPGAFCWVELGTTDCVAARSFYHELLGWQMIEHPLPDGGVYTLLQVDGKNVAALYQISERLRTQRQPPHWLLYIATDDVDDSARKARALGGRVTIAPLELPGAGRMAVINDPTNAAFALWEARKHSGVQLRNEPGALCWQELATNDEEVAKLFYASLFDWEPQTAPLGGTSYTMFRKGKLELGGMLQMTEEWGNIAPHWMAYFAVTDCDERAEQAQILGGKVSVPPTDIPGVGRFAVIQDPQGAVFSIISLSHP